MKLIKVLILFLIVSSCSTNNNPVKTGYTRGKIELDSFLKERFPKTLDLDINNNDIFDRWQDIFLINSVKKIPFVDSRQLNYPINSLDQQIY